MNGQSRSFVKQVQVDLLALVMLTCAMSFSSGSMGALPLLWPSMSQKGPARR